MGPQIGAVQLDAPYVEVRLPVVDRVGLVERRGVNAEGERSTRRGVEDVARRGLGVLRRVGGSGRAARASAGADERGDQRDRP